MAKKQLQLGRPSPIPSSLIGLFSFASRTRRGRELILRFTVLQFIASCPITGQPDFAHLVIDFLPARSLVESKSLKLYFNSFRNYGAFHEDCTVAIGKKLNSLSNRMAADRRLLVSAGGMPIDVFWQTGKCPRTSGCRIKVSRPSRPRLNRRNLPAHLQRTDPSRYCEGDRSNQQHGIDADAVEAKAVEHGARGLTEKEEHGMRRRRRAASSWRQFRDVTGISTVQQVKTETHDNKIYKLDRPGVVQ